MINPWGFLWSVPKGSLPFWLLAKSWDSSANMGYNRYGKSWEILEKSWEIMGKSWGNPGKSWEIMGYLNASHDGCLKMAIS